MEPQNPYQPAVEPTTEPPALKPLPAARPDEQVICEIKRHPIGMFGIYIAVGFLLLVLAVVAFAVAPNIFTSYDRGQVMSIGAIVFVAAAAIGTGFLFIAGKVYWGNTWTLTNESIIQVKRISLFDKQTSELSLANLEDITAEQDGLLAQMFHYGVISAETAAATDKFTFLYCPNPTYYTQKVLEAREHFEQTRPHNPSQT
jgi:hypothetical protein